MNVFDRLLSIVAPHECLGCGLEGSLFCPTCAAAMVTPAERCYRCHRLTPGAETCGSCQTLSRLRSVHTACLYREAAKALIWKLKLAGAREAARHMAARMLPHLPVTDEAIIVSVPTATTRIRRRGYDQAELLARELARQSGLRYVACLARTTQTKQHGASRDQRLRQLMSAFRTTPARSLIRGEHVILIDDVVTTGASLEAAAAVLKAAGARRIDAVVFAQA